MRKSKEKIFSPEEAAVISESVKQSSDLIENKIKYVNWLMAGVVIVLFVAVVTMLLMTVQVVIEAYRFNSTMYKESQQLKLYTDQQKLILEELEQIKKNFNKLK